ncbi:MAG: hypothetical protein KAR25_08130, partial [Methanosarcinales archaeon]|nr:hypothetical protein [Methanosarcinales archaeon]
TLTSRLCSDITLPRANACTPQPRPPTSEPRDRHVMPESRKHPRERPITNRSGKKYPARLRLTVGALRGAKDIMQEKNELGM